MKQNLYTYYNKIYQNKMKNKHKSCNNNKKIELLIDFNISRQKKQKKKEIIML